MTQVDFYDKEQVDDLLGTKANSADVYTKSEANTLLSAKANSADVYTKSEANTLLSAKANSADVYTKSEANTLLSAKADKTAVDSLTVPDVQILSFPTYEGLTITATDDATSANKAVRIGNLIVVFLALRVTGTYTGTSGWVNLYEPFSIPSGKALNSPYFVGDVMDPPLTAIRLLNGRAIYVENGSTVNVRVETQVIHYLT